MNKNQYFFFPEKINFNMPNIVKALRPDMISVEESRQLGMKTIQTLYTKFSEQVKQNPGLMSYNICYPWSVDRMMPSLEKDFELIVSAFGWKVVNWDSYSVTISVK